MAIPPNSLAALLSPHLPSVAVDLKSIPSVTVGIVNLGYRNIQQKLKGFGYLVPKSENEEILGVVWDSSAFPSQNKHPHEVRLTVMIREEHLLSHGKNLETTAAEIALKAVGKHLNIIQRPDSVCVKIAQNAIPQYIVEHADKLRKIESALQNLPSPVNLLGNGYYGAAVNDCIAKAKEIAFS